MHLPGLAAVLGCVAAFFYLGWWFLQTALWGSGRSEGDNTDPVVQVRAVPHGARTCLHTCAAARTGMQA